MGDRGNIVVRSSHTGQVWFYTHWSGSDITGVVKRALAKKWRWNDAPYLARIVFDELTAGEQGNETGFGISTSIGDNSHAICLIDVDRQKVSMVKESALTGGKIPEKDFPGKSFDKFIA